MVSVTRNTNRESVRGHQSVFKPPAIGEGDMNNPVRTFKKVSTEIPGLFPARRILHPILFVAILILAAGCGPAGGPFIVNNPGDAGDSHPGDGICRTAASATACTLRAALEETDALAGSDSIRFNLPAGSLTILPHTALPVITGELTIDGTTQPGYTDDPIVIIDGSDLTTPLTNGLETADGSDVTLRGLQVMHATKHGIYTRGTMRLEHVLSGNSMRSGLSAFGDPDQIAVTIEYSEFSENTGAGISAVNADLTITHLRAINNHFGGMALAGGGLHMSASLIMDNVTPAAGGGISVSGDVHASLYTSEISNNRATDVGGGVFFQGGEEAELSFWHCTLSGNESAQGGGLYQQGGYVNMDPGNTVIDNRADSGGGGIYLNGGMLEVGRSAIGQTGHGNDADADDNTVWPPGGGIYNQGGNLFVFSSSVEGNNGSGIFNTGGSVRLYDSHVESNSRHGVHSVAETGRADVQVESSWISFNGMSGIEAEKTNLTVTGSSLTENRSNGIFTAEGHVTISDSTMADNDHSGLYLENSDGAEIERSAFWGNGRMPTDRGGGILIWIFNPTVVQVENVTIHDNHATVSGGGLDVAHGAAFLNNVTISQNTAPDGAGIHNSGALSVANSILAENTGGNCGGTITSLGHNIDNGSTCGLSAAGDLPGTAITLGPMHDNGGPTFTRALFYGSPAVDAGNDATCAIVDQRGVARPQMLHCDIGAFEIQPIGKSGLTPPAATSAPTPAITPTATPTSAAANILFDPVQFSSDQIFQGGKTCSPMELSIKVKVTPAEAVHTIALYYRLVEKDGTGASEWSEGQKMDRLGNGWYQLALFGNDLPSIYGWKHEAWLDIQFVANDSNYQPVARSAVIRQVTVRQCSRKD
jgi:hypothetical protein